MSVWDSGSICMGRVCWMEAERFQQPETEGWAGELLLPCVVPLTVTGCRNSGLGFSQVSRHWQDQAIRPEVCTSYTSFLGSCLVGRGGGWARDGSEGAQVTHSQSQAGVVHPECGPQTVLIILALFPRPLGRFLYFGVVGAWRERGRRKPTNLLVLIAHIISLGPCRPPGIPIMWLMLRQWQQFTQDCTACRGQSLSPNPGLLTPSGPRFKWLQVRAPYGYSKCFPALSHLNLNHNPWK